VKSYYKYIHLLYCHDLKFCESFIKTIQGSEGEFDIAEHAFITPNKNVFDDLNVVRYKNIFYDNSGKNLYIRYASHCEWIISHGLDDSYRVILTPKKIRSKVLYRYWGGSLTTHLKLNKKKPIQYLKNYIKIQLFRNVMESFAAIGVANNVDVLDFNKLCTGIKYYRMPYADKEMIQSRIDIMRKIETEQFRKKESAWILLGHRGKEEDNHINILKMLGRFDSNQIRIIIPLSYGDKDYIDSVCEYVQRNNINNVDIIKAFLPYEEYVKLLSTIDIAIFDGFTSYALGNIALVLALKKKIYLNKKGVIREAFDMDAIPYSCIDDIKEMSFEEFVDPINYPDNLDSSLISSMDADYAIKAWKIVFTDFC